MAAKKGLGKGSGSNLWRGSYKRTEGKDCQRGWKGKRIDGKAVIDSAQQGTAQKDL